MAAAAVRHTVKTVLAQTVQLAQPATAHSSRAKPATAAQIADATGPQTLVTAPASLVTPQTTAQLATHVQRVTANAVRLVTVTHAHSAMVSVDHSATAHSVTANAVHSVTATAVHARLHVMVSVVNGLLAETVATSVHAMANAASGLHATLSATTADLVTVLAPKSAQAAVHSATVPVLQLAVNTVAATHRVTASAVTV